MEGSEGEGVKSRVKRFLSRDMVTGGTFVQFSTDMYRGNPRMIIPVECRRR